MYMTLPRFAQSLGGCSLTSLSHWGHAPSLHSVTGRCSLTSLSRWGMLPCLAQSLGGCSLTLLSCWVCSLASLGHSIHRGPIKYFHQIVKWLSTPNSYTTGSDLIICIKCYKSENDNSFSFLVTLWSVFVAKNEIKLPALFTLE